MAKGSIVGWLLAGLVSLAWAGEPDEVRMDFKGLPLGSTEAQVQAHTPVTCGADRTGEFDRQCVVRDRANRSYAGRPAQQVLYGFFGDRLDSVVVLLDHRQFELVKQAMDEKFGAVAPDGGVTERSTYRMNGDRAYLYRMEAAAVVRYEAAAGNEERARRWESVRSKLRKDM